MLIMNNHYHLLLETPRGNLGQIMHNVGSSYVKRHNIQNDCDGSLFRGRYKSILI